MANLIGITGSLYNNILWSIVWAYMGQIEQLIHFWKLPTLSWHQARHPVQQHEVAGPTELKTIQKNVTDVCKQAVSKQMAQP